MQAAEVAAFTAPVATDQTAVNHAAADQRQELLAADIPRKDATPQRGAPIFKAKPEMPRILVTPPATDDRYPSAMAKFDAAPPRPSTWRTFSYPHLAAVGGKTVGDVSRYLDKALDAAGYKECSYFQIAGGFALATRAERITDLGQPFTENRWVSDSVGYLWPANGKEYLSRLLLKEVGRYRLYVFIVATDLRMALDAQPYKTTSSWYYKSKQSLPSWITSLPLLPEHELYVLVYEYSAAKGEDPKQLFGPIDAAEHLRRSKLKI